MKIFGASFLRENNIIFTSPLEYKIWVLKKLITLFFFLFLVALIGYWLNQARTFQLFGEIYAKVETNQKVVALTLDDGPNERLDTVLAILKLHNVKATFFPIGNLMEKRPTDISRILHEGHELGNHSYTHQALSFKSYQTIREEIEPTDVLLRQAGCKGAIHFRPPYGMKIFMLPLFLKLNNRKTIMWDISPEGDPELDQDVTKLSKFVIENTKNGSIILLHPMNDGRETSLLALDPIIRGLKAKGFVFKTISELLDLEND